MLAETSPGQTLTQRITNFACYSLLRSQATGTFGTQAIALLFAQLGRHVKVPKAFLVSKEGRAW